jgi:hypothetical protein
MASLIARALLFFGVSALVFSQIYRWALPYWDLNGREYTGVNPVFLTVAAACILGIPGARIALNLFRILMGSAVLNLKELFFGEWPQIASTAFFALSGSLILAGLAGIILLIVGDWPIFEVGQGFPSGVANIAISLILLGIGSLLTSFIVIYSLVVLSRLLRKNP